MSKILPPTTSTRALSAIFDTLCCFVNRFTFPIPVTIDNQPVEVDPSAAFEALFENLGDRVIAAIGQQSGDLEEINANINGQPIQVAGTVTVAGNGDPTEIVWDRDQIQAAFGELEVDTGLEDFLANNTLSFTLGGEVLNIDDTAILAALADVNTTLQNTVRVDYEKVEACVLDASGERVPRTGVFVERSYNFTGVLLSSNVVLSELQPDGTFSAYTLQAGESVGDCPVVEIDTDDDEFLGSLMCYGTAPQANQTTFFDPPALDPNTTITVVGDTTDITTSAGSNPDLVEVLDRLVECVALGATVSVEIDDAGGGFTEIDISQATVTGGNQYQITGATVSSGLIPAAQTVSIITLSCSNLPDIETKAYARNNDSGELDWFDHITNVQLTNEQVGALRPCDTTIATRCKDELATKIADAIGPVGGGSADPVPQFAGQVCYTVAIGGGEISPQEKRLAYGYELLDGTLEYRDSITNQVVVIDDTNIFLPLLTDTPLFTQSERVDDGTDRELFAPFRSVSVTSFSDDVTVNGQAIPNGFTFTLNSDAGQSFIDPVFVTGNDYFTTIVN